MLSLGIALSSATFIRTLQMRTQRKIAQYGNRVSKVSEKLRLFSFGLLMIMPISSFFGSAIPDILLSIIAITFLIKSVTERDFNWAKQSWQKAALVLWGYLVIRSTWAEDIRFALSSSLPWVRFPLFAAAVANWLITKERDLSKLLFSIFLTLLFISINTIGQFVLEKDIFGNVINYSAYPRLVTPAGKLTPGIMMSFLVLPLVSTALLNQTNRYYSAVCAITILAIFLTGERTAFITTFMGLGFVLVFNKSGRKLLVPFAVLTLATGMFFYVAKKEVIARQITSTINSLSNYSADSYGIINAAAINIFKKNWLFGAGPKHYNIECQKPDRTFMSEMQIKSYCAGTTHPHNIFLEMLVDGGVIGFTIFLAFIYRLMAHIAKNQNKILKHPFALGSTAEVIVKLFPFAPISSFYFAWSMAPFWLMVGVITCNLFRK